MVQGIESFWIQVMESRFTHQSSLEYPFWEKFIMGLSGYMLFILGGKIFGIGLMVVMMLPFSKKYIPA